MSLTLIDETFTHARGCGSGGNVLVLFLGYKFSSVEKGCTGTGDPIGEAGCLSGVLVVHFGAYVIGETICKSFQREFTSWFVLILVAFDPAYVGCNGKVCYFMLDSL